MITLIDLFLNQKQIMINDALNILSTIGRLVMYSKGTVKTTYDLVRLGIKVYNSTVGSFRAEEKEL